MSNRRIVRLFLCFPMMALLLAGCLAPDMTPYVEMTDSSATTPMAQSRYRSAATQIIQAIARRDASTVKRLVSPDRYIRHDNRLPGDRRALLMALADGQRPDWQVRVVRTLVDGNYVMTHNEYRSGGKTYAGFEVYQFDGDYAVESWKAMQLMPSPNPSGRTLLDGATDIVDHHLVKANKSLVGRVAEEILFKGNFKMFPVLMSEPYLQHNPLIADGIDGVLAEAAKREQGALWAFDYKRPLLLLGEGNFGVTMMEIEYDGASALHFDLFRMESGKVREHWDLYELMPPT